MKSRGQQENVWYSRYKSQSNHVPSHWITVMDLEIVQTSEIMKTHALKLTCRYLHTFFSSFLLLLTSQHCKNGHGRKNCPSRVSFKAYNLSFRFSSKETSHDTIWSSALDEFQSFLSVNASSRMLRYCRFLLFNLVFILL